MKKSASLQASRSRPPSTNWTLPSPLKRKKNLVPRRQPLDDVEGSRPALRQFARWNQRIIADPYPSSHCAPQTIDHKKYGVNPLCVLEEAAAKMLCRNPVAPRVHPFMIGSSKNGENTLLVKERTAFVPSQGHYVTNRVVVTAQKRQELQPKRPSATCDDVEGATPRSYAARLEAQAQRARTPPSRRQRPDLFNVADIAGASPRSPSAGRVVTRRSAAAPSAHPSIYPSWWS